MGDIFEEELEEVEDLSTLEDPQDSGDISDGGDFVFPSPLFKIKLEYSCEIIYATHPSMVLNPGDYVVIPTKFGNDIGLVNGAVKVPLGIKPDEVVTIVRKASPEDIHKHNEFLKKELQAFEICKKKIEERKLDMKLVTTHYLLDEPKVLFFFSADNRVDFRDLVKDLVAVFRMRIELRQIGVRDESRITGGLGVCGRPYCCHGLTDKLKPVSIRMAKDQNLSLNSMKISGQCGRLLCCLAYEHDWYSEEKQNLPNEGVRLVYEGVPFKVCEVLPLCRSVKIKDDEGRIVEIHRDDLERQNGIWKIKNKS